MDSGILIGFQHPKVIDAIKRQADLLTTIAPQAANEARGEAASRIVALASPSHEKVFFTNGGADGVENAIRMARIHTSRHKILSFYRSYHGNTTSAISATGDPRRWPNEFGYGHVHFFGPYLYRSAFWAKSEEEECQRALEHLESVIEFEGPKTVAAILIESVVGTAGVLIPPKGYLEGVRRLCDKYGILWIADEVMSGFGRTGKWFAYQHSTVHPDLIVFAKGVNSGYVPLGGVVISKEIAETFKDRVFPGGLTYSGHPLACAAAVATIDAMKDEKIVEAQNIATDFSKIAEKTAKESFEILNKRLLEGTGSSCSSVKTSSSTSETCSTTTGSGVFDFVVRFLLVFVSTGGTTSRVTLSVTSTTVSGSSTTTGTVVTFLADFEFCVLAFDGIFLYKFSFV